MQKKISAFLLCALTLGALGAGTTYQPAELLSDEVNANLNGKMGNIVPNREVYWKISGLNEGKYSIRLEIPGLPENIIYHNGKRIDFDSASPVVNGISTMQSDFIDVKNGDVFWVIKRYPMDLFNREAHVGTMTLAKERLPFAPQKHFESNTLRADNSYAFDNTEFDEKLSLKIVNRTGKNQKLKVHILITDFYQIPVAEYMEDVDAGINFAKTFDYPKGKSEQYRAFIKITDSEGKSTEDVYAYVRNWSGKYRSKVWLTDNWMMTEVKDDGTLKTRNLQALPPENAQWRKVKLPTTFSNHIAWFKKDFTLPENFAGERRLLHFDRICYEADIYLNGEKLHHYGTETSLAPFEVDVTDKLKKGKNTLLLCLRGTIAMLKESELNAKNPRMSNWKFFGFLSQGISDVTLLGKPKISVGDLKIYTSYRDKTLEVQTEVPEGYTVENRVLRQGNEVLRFTSKAKWENPILWGPEKFPLLQLQTLLMKNGKVVDCKDTRFGFREIWTDKMNVVWNGQVIKTSSHAMLDSWGARNNGSRTPIMKLLHTITKQMNIRMARHIYNAGIFAEIADEAGIIFAQGMITPAGPSIEMVKNDSFWKHVMDSDLSIIKAQFNHPSIFTWYISNEFLGFSNPNFGKRLDAILRAVSKADPTRFAEAGCDIDMHGEMKINSVHYPIEWEVSKMENAYQPDMWYWRDLRTQFKVGDMVPNGFGRSCANCNVMSPIKWGEKPIIVNESGLNHMWSPPRGITRYAGDEHYISWPYANKYFIQIHRMQYQGQRDAGVSVKTPWVHWFFGQQNTFMPDLEMVVIQRYHSFVSGTKPVFDVNLFHDLYPKETLAFRWKLTQDGKTVQQGGRDIFFDGCSEAREKVIPDLKNPGAYELTFSLTGLPDEKRIITVGAPEQLVLKPNMIAGNVALNKDELLKRAENGETLVIFPRKDYPAWLPGAPVATGLTPSTNFTFRTEHPLLKGISEADFSYWYPKHCTGEGYFIKPHYGNTKTILEAGGPNGLRYSGLLEVPYGKGGFVYCALNLDPEQNPIAALFLKNLGNYRIKNDYFAAGLIARSNAEFLKQLKLYGISTEKAEFGKLAKFKVLIVDGEMSFTPEQIAELKAFKGTVFIQNPGKSFGISTSPVTMPEWTGRAIRVGYFPEIAGLTNEDLFFRSDPLDEGVIGSWYGKKNIIDNVGSVEILNGTPMIYPVFLSKEGNMIYSNLNWMTTKKDIEKKGQTLISTIMTNLNVEQKQYVRPEIPAKLSWRQLDLTKILNRTMSDEVESDGKGGFTDQGAESDMREFKLNGLHTLAGIPFRIEYPNACFMLANRYLKGGYDKVTIPVDAKFDVLAWLHTHAYTARVHHYSVFVNYADGSTYEIRMDGNLNLTDWAEPPKKRSTELDTLTEPAVTVKQKRWGTASLYRTAWLNPAPGKDVKSITVVSMNHGVPLILAFSIGMKPQEIVITAELDAAHLKLMNEAYSLQKAKKYKEAIVVYEKALKLIPQRLEPYRSIAACYEDIGDWGKAYETYQRSLAINHSQPDLWPLEEEAKRRSGK